MDKELVKNLRKESFDTGWFAGMAQAQKAAGVNTTECEALRDKHNSAARMYHNQIITWDATFTEDQAKFLVENSHIVSLARLPDGDWLVADLANDVDGYGPYVLSRDGRMDWINNHYISEHGVDGLHMRNY